MLKNVRKHIIKSRNENEINDILNQLRELVIITEDKIESYYNEYRVENDKGHFYIDSNGKVKYKTGYTEIDDKYNKDYPNRFRTKEFAEYKRDQLRLIRNMERFSMDNRGFKIDWEDTEQRKYFIQLSIDDDHEVKLMIDYTFNNKDIEKIYFISYPVAKKAIEVFGDEYIEIATRGTKLKKDD